MKTRFDPKLKEMMDELEPIFKKYEAFGFVSVTNRTHGEFKFFIPEYSVFKIGPEGARFRAKSGETPHADVESTVFGLLSMKDMAARLYMNVDSLEVELRKHMEIDHNKGEIYSHGED